MRTFKKRIAHQLYKYLSNVLREGEIIEKKIQLDSLAKLDSSVKIFSESAIENLANNPDLISVGLNSVIKGQLLVFAHDGKIQIGKDCYLGEGSRIWSASSVTIGDRVLISHNVNIHDTNSHPVDPILRHKHFIEIISKGHPKEDPGIVSKPIVIEDDVWIGFNSIILKGVTIGRGSIVGAGSVVVKDVPEASVVLGNLVKSVNSV